MHFKLSMGLPLPSWCSKQDFEVLKIISNISYETLVATFDLQRMTVGPTLDVLLGNAKNNARRKKKIYLFGAHDINIATFTRTHNFTGIPELPDYGSAIVIETIKDLEKNLYVQVSTSTQNYYNKYRLHAKIFFLLFTVFAIFSNS